MWVASHNCVMAINFELRRYPGDDPLRLRRYRDDDRASVRDLFIKVNRKLAPQELREEFESYIDLSLREEIERIPEYYDDARRRSFWIATKAEFLVGFFGLEPADAETVELRRMYVEPLQRHKGAARWMLGCAEEIARDDGFSKVILSTSAVQEAAIMLYLNADYTFVREDRAMAANNKTVGSGIRRFYFEKALC